ncbi:MAG: hypothetical protein ACI84C_001072 [Flavobacteriales bacterium]|jgi:hypothetical protein
MRKRFHKNTLKRLTNRLSIFSEKSILIISTESWGAHFVSKHHYAVQLAKMGNKVYFLNPPNGDNKVEKKDGLPENLNIVSFSGTPGLRLMPTKIATTLQQRDARKLAELCETKFDLIWSFDNSRFYDLSVFRKCLKIAHIMDLAVDFHTQVHASSADYCFGVTREIVSRMGQYNPKSFFINHGFYPIELDAIQHNPSERKQVGYSGNLLLKFIDRKLVLSLVQAHPKVHFNFYGGHAKSNLSDGSDQEGVRFIENLKQEKNVHLHGALPRTDLMQALNNQDVLLLFYDAKKYAGACHNSHKILEYLSTGQEILSLPVLEYSHSKLINHAANHDEYLRGFEELLTKKTDANLHRDRIAYAADHTYIRQIERIQNIIDGE